MLKDKPANAVTPVSISRVAARRFLLHRQGLLQAQGGPLRPASAPWADLPAGPAGALAALQRLECVQIDPVNTVAPNHHLVLANRVPGYQQEHLEDLIDDTHVFEHFLQARCVIPVADFAYFRPRFEDLAEQLAGHFQAVGSLPAEILAHIQRHGPATTRDFSSNKVVGYWDASAVPRTKASSLALELLWETGQLAISGRSGNQRYYDLTERRIPKAILSRLGSLPDDEAWQAIRHKYYRAFGLFDSGDFRFGWRHRPAAARRAVLAADMAAGVIVPVAIEGVRRAYYALTADLPSLQAAETWEGGSRAAFLSPLDNLLWRRERLQDAFEFQYTWEQYTPAAKRQFGHYAMPILYGDRLVGRLDPRLDREARVLVVNSLVLEPGVRPTKGLARSISQAMTRLLTFLGADQARYDRIEPAGLASLLE